MTLRTIGMIRMGLLSLEPIITCYFFKKNISACNVQGKDVRPVEKTFQTGQKTKEGEVQGKKM